MPVSQLNGDLGACLFGLMSLCKKMLLIFNRFCMRCLSLQTNPAIFIGSILSIIFLLVETEAHADDSVILEGLQWDSPIPRFRELGIEPVSLHQLAEQKIVVLAHPERSLNVSLGGDRKSFDKARIVSAMTVIDAPVDKVKAVVSDYKNYTNVMPRTEKATIIKTFEKHQWVEYLLVFKLPAWAIKIKYLFRYTQEDNGDISVQLLDGGGEAGAGRWEFIPLSGNKTLLVFSNWNDFENSGFFFRAVIKSQADFKTIVPVVSTTIAVEAIKKQFAQTSLPHIPQVQNRVAPNSKKKLPKVPDYNESEEAAMSALANFGMVFVLHPAAEFSAANKPVKVEYVSVIKKVNAGKSDISKLVTNFDGYSDLISQIENIGYRKTNKGFETDWYLKLKLGPLVLPMQYSMDYVWLNEDCLYFYLTEGDLESIYGVLKWNSLGSEGLPSLFRYTLAVSVGDNLPLALKILNKIPRQSLLSGIFMGTVLVENQSRWLEEQVLY